MTQARLEREAEDRWRLSGEVTLATAPGLADQGRRLIKGLQATSGQAEVGATNDNAIQHRRTEPTPWIQLDLSEITRAQSVAIALMLDWQAQLRERGLELQIHHCPKGLHRIAKFSNVDALIGLEDPEDP